MDIKELVGIAERDRERERERERGGERERAFIRFTMHNVVTSKYEVMWIITGRLLECWHDRNL